MELNLYFNTTTQVSLLGVNIFSGNKVLKEKLKSELFEQLGVTVAYSSKDDKDSDKEKITFTDAMYSKEVIEKTLDFIKLVYPNLVCLGLDSNGIDVHCLFNNDQSEDVAQCARTVISMYHVVPKMLVLNEGVFFIPNIDKLWKSNILDTLVVLQAISDYCPDLTIVASVKPKRYLELGELTSLQMTVNTNVLYLSQTFGGVTVLRHEKL